jgi:hypothetical protein
LFGRRPREADRRWFEDLLRRDWHHSGVRLFDVAAMLGPTPDTSPLADGIAQITSPAAFERTVLEPQVNAGQSPELLLFASFAASLTLGQTVRDAIQELASFWLGRGGRLRFGGHPTITPTIDYIAHDVIPGDERERVTVFQSGHFVTKATLREVARWATVVETDATGYEPADRASSLTIMRRQMILESDAVAAVVIGGLTPDDLLAQGRTELPGVEEELVLARQRSLPVFLLGTTGGHAAILAERARSEDTPWSSLGNQLSADENDDLARSDDYGSIAETIWDATVDEPSP